MARPYNLVDTAWELTDPNPDIFAMFVEFNREFFWNQLGGVEVKWSKRMTLCAGLCRYAGKMGMCTVVLSEPLLKLRARKDLVETLLHEMIHAYLFVADGNREHDAHGPKFQAHMRRINDLTGTDITIYHSFHDEVSHYKTHWWKCDGPCQHRPPFFGMVKRSMNRKPGPYDFWFKGHQSTCGGTFIKVKEPEATGKKKQGSSKNPEKAQATAAGKPATSHKIDEYFPKTGGQKLGSAPAVKKTPSATYTPSSASTTATSASPAAKPTSSTSGISAPKPTSSPFPFPVVSRAPPNESFWTRKAPQVKKPGSKFPGALNPKFPGGSHPKLPSSTNQVPNNSKENKGKGNSGQPGSYNNKPPGGGGLATGSATRTVTVVTLDDDDEPRPSNSLSSINNNTSSNRVEVTPQEVPKPASTGFVPFSGKGHVLGSSSSSSKRPKYS